MKQIDRHSQTPSYTEVVAQNRELRRENQRLRQEREQLRVRVEQLERTGRTTRASPGSKPGHKAAWRRKPQPVDERVEVALDRCPHCGGSVLFGQGGRAVYRRASGGAPTCDTSGHVHWAMSALRQGTHPSSARDLDSNWCGGGTSCAAGPRFGVGPQQKNRGLPAARHARCCTLISDSRSARSKMRRGVPPKRHPVRRLCQPSPFAPLPKSSSLHHAKQVLRGNDRERRE